YLTSPERHGIHLANTGIPWIMGDAVAGEANAPRVLNLPGLGRDAVVESDESAPSNAIAPRFPVRGEAIVGVVPVDEDEFDRTRRQDTLRSFTARQPDPFDRSASGTLDLTVRDHCLHAEPQPSGGEWVDREEDARWIHRRAEASRRDAVPHPNLHEAFST